MILLVDTTLLQNTLLLIHWHITVGSKHQINVKHETVDAVAVYIL